VSVRLENRGCECVGSVIGYIVEEVFECEAT
jgi:hypothetical protein